MKKFSKSSSDRIVLRFGKGEIKAGFAGSFLKRALGLSFRRSLGKDGGLFFSFPRRHRPVFWNFGMRFPIDIVWMDGGRIIGVEENIPPMGGGLRVFSPPQKADSALEVMAGSAGVVGAEIGGIINAVYGE